jgi:single-strand DNA-binding protein
MSFQLTGKLKKIDPIVQVSEKFSKREFVITDESSQYPQDILFQSVQDKCSLLDTYNVGDVVQVSFNLRGREWTSPTNEVKYFNTLEAWRIEGGQTQATAPASTPAAQANTTTAPASAPVAQPQNTMVSSTDDDDLPF